MQAYKLKGKINSLGHLIIKEPIELAPGNVEVIILQEVEKGAASNPKADLEPETTGNRVQGKTKILRDWFANTQPAPSDFDPEQARWEALKEKHQL